MSIRQPTTFTDRRATSPLDDFLSAISGEPWMRQAVCASTGGADDWFPSQGEANRAAKRVCRGCPVQQECLDYALRRGEVHFGIYGGTTPTTRQRMRRERGA
ncbi:MAG: WhiB family transcriptional regulator [Mycobacteriales bacterium]